MNQGSRGPLTRVLYVEDDADIRAIATMALEMVGGFTVKACSSGTEALAAADNFEPDLLLLDVMMPEMDGPTTLSGLRNLKLTGATPAVFMTAKVQANELAYYLSLGALGVIAKPFDPMTLADQLRKIWSS